MGDSDVTPRRRAFRSRSTTGCSPCKDARVKCQEEKPHCQRCRRLHLVCVYVPTVARKKTAPIVLRGKRALLPAAPRPGAGDPVLIPSPSTAPRLSPRQALYYSFFRTHVVSQLCSQVPAGFWLRTILRECTLDKSVIDSAIGIGALAYLEHSQNHWNLPLLNKGHRLVANSGEDNRGQHYEVALAHYTRALANFRRRMSSHDQTSLAARSVLICSLLFIIFELLQGNLTAVDVLSAGCFKALGSNLLRRDSHCRSAIAANLDDDGVQDAEFLLIRLTVLRGLVSPLYPAANAIAQGFHLPVDFDLQIPDSSEPSIERFIIVWKHIWTVVSLWCLRALRNETRQAQSPALSSGDSPQCSPQGLQKERQVLLDMTERCRIATQERLDIETSSVAQRLLEYALALGNLHYVILSPSADALENIWDCNLDACLEVVDLGERFVKEAAASGLSQSLIFDGPVPTLLQMVQGCRDRVLRRRATGLLAQLVTPRSSWENKSLFLGTCGLMDMEERERAPDGSIGLAARYDWTHAVWSNDHTYFCCTYTAKGAVPGAPRREVRLLLKLEDSGLASAPHSPLKQRSQTSADSRSLS